MIAVELPAGLRMVVKELYATGRSAWPEITVDEAAFRSWVIERVADDPDVARVLAAISAEDAYLACACTLRAPGALDAFERRHLTEATAALQRIDRSPAFLDDVKQLVRQKLFVDGKIADYSGRGRLAAWTRVAAVRTAITLRRQGKNQILLDDDALMALPSSTEDPELDYLKTRYLKDFKAAFQDAMVTLTARERTLLRLYFIDDLTVAQLGVMFRVHLATAARWIAAARAKLFNETRRLLIERLHLSDPEFDSLLRLVQSQLEISIVRFLGPEP